MKFASGGVISGGPVDDDSVPVLLSHGCSLGGVPVGMSGSEAMRLLEALNAGEEDQ